MSIPSRTMQCSHSKPRTRNVVSRQTDPLSEHLISLVVATSTETCPASALGAITVEGLVARVANDTGAHVSTTEMRAWLARRGIDVLTSGRIGLRITSPWPPSAVHALHAIRKGCSGQTGER